MKFRLIFSLLLAIASGLSYGDEAAPAKKDPATGQPRKITPELRAAIEKLELPGVKINLDEWCVDVESRVCLKEGLLELIACTKDTKEHESIIAIEAKPSHVHTALLLIGAKNGSPAQRQAIDPEMTRFRDIPPSGSPVDVFLVFNNSEGKKVEMPISDFIKPAEHHDASVEPDADEEDEKFGTHTFIFAGSVIVGKDDGPRRYLCDTEGNVISITTFGDELLCLPDFHENANGALMWAVDGDKLPELNSTVTLRLRPSDGKKQPGAEPGQKAEKNPAEK